MPMIGLGIAISILVGKYLGKDNPAIAERCVYSGFYLMFSYMAIVAALYVFVPNIFLAPYAALAQPDSFEFIKKTTLVLLRFVAFYSLFDALNITFSYAIKGAGDTRFVMIVIIINSLVVLVIPTYIALVIFHAHIYVGWALASIFIVILGLTFLFRFLGGKWKSMRVIEPIPPSIPATIPEAPAFEVEP
jgi:MATE family multidrug resistance protein